MHIGVLTHNYPRFPGDFSGTFVEALCEELATQGQQVTVWAPYDPAYQPPAGRTGDAAPLPLRLAGFAPQVGLHAQHAGGSGVAAGGISAQPGVLRRRHRHGAARGAPEGGRMCSTPIGRCPTALSARWSAASWASRWWSPCPAPMPRWLTATPSSAAWPASPCARPACSPPTAPTCATLSLPLGAELSKFDMIIYGTDPNALRPDPTGVAELRARLQIPDDATVALCVGRMVPKKGFDVLIRALADPALQPHKMVAVMVGEGDDKAAWMELASRLGVGGSTALGGECAQDGDRDLLQPVRLSGHALGQQTRRRAQRLRAGRHELRQSGRRHAGGRESPGHCGRRAPG